MNRQCSPLKFSLGGTLHADREMCPVSLMVFFFEMDSLTVVTNNFFLDGILEDLRH